MQACVWNVMDHLQTKLIKMIEMSAFELFGYSQDYGDCPGIQTTSEKLYYGGEYL